MTRSASIVSAARDYVGFWPRERPFIDGLAQRDSADRLQALQKAAGYFRVARNFPLSHDVKRGLPRLAPALAVLDRHRSPSLTPAVLSNAVTKVRTELAAAYGRKDLLSAATKFLWLLHRHPVVIYDANVRKALSAPGNDYSAYVALWNARYSELLPEIRVATETLERNGVAEAREEWFRRRVLDIYLWHVGA